MEFGKGIEKMNFSDAKQLQDMIWISVRQDLKQQDRLIGAQLEGLNQVPDDLLQEPRGLQKGLTDKLQKLQERQQYLASEKEKIAEQLRDIQKNHIVDEQTEVVLNEQFIQDFANHFKDISHLTAVLSDAPQAIKSIQIDLYVAILSNLDKEEKEKQIATLVTMLDVEQIKNFLNTATQAFDRIHDEARKPLYQELVHATIFQMIRKARDEELAKTSDKGPESYGNFLTRFLPKIPDTEGSTLLNSLVHYQSVEGESIQSCIDAIEHHYQITPEIIWANPIIPNAKKLLTDRLHFGQEAQLEFVEKRKDNTTRDLFWARTAYDYESFRNSRRTEAQLKALKERNHVMAHLDEYKESTDFDRSTKVASYAVNPNGSEIFNENEKKALERMEHILDKVKVQILENFISKFYNEIIGENRIMKNVGFDRSPLQFHQFLRKELLNFEIIKSRGDDYKRTLETSLNSCNSAEGFFNTIKHHLNETQRMKFYGNFIHDYFINNKNTSQDVSLNTEKINSLMRNNHRLWQPTWTLVEPIFGQSLNEYSKVTISHNKDTGNFETRLSYLNPTPVRDQFERWFTANESALTNQSKKDSFLFRKSDSVIKGMLDNAIAVEQQQASPQRSLTPLMAKKAFVANFSSHAFIGKTFEHIAQQIQCLHIEGVKPDFLTAVKLTYENMLTKVREKAASQDLTTIPSLKLNEDQQIVLYKLIELHYVHQFQSDIENITGGRQLFELSSELVQAFKCIAPTPPSLVDYLGAVNIYNIGNAIAQAEQQIAAFDRPEGSMPYTPRPSSVGLALPATSPSPSPATTAAAGAASAGRSRSPDVPLLNLHSLPREVSPPPEGAGTYRMTNIRSVDHNLGEIVTEAKSRVDANKIRADRKQAIENIFQRDLSTEQARERASLDIQRIYLEEHAQFRGFLGLNDELNRRMQEDTQQMANELIRLISRTQQGQSVLDDKESELYFSVMQEIVRNLPKDRSLSDYQFTIPAEASGEQSIQLILNPEIKRSEQSASGNQDVVIRVNLGATGLPYSLIKPPGDQDILFSFGGHRGVVAPFADFDEAYAKSNPTPALTRARFFTRGRTDEGQYGTVETLQNLLSGLMVVMKKGIIKSAVQDAQRLTESHLTRALVSKEQPMAQSEGNILTELSIAERNSRNGKQHSIAAQYWESRADQASNEEYHLLMSRAAGEDYKKTSDRVLSLYTKGDDRYHNPEARFPTGISAEEKLALTIRETKENLKLAIAISEEVQRLHELGFTHNDIKPENFLYKKRDNGTYRVEFIDWATAGYRKPYQGKGTDQSAIFKEVFGVDPKDLRSFTIEGETFNCDPSGRFVQVDPQNPNQFFYGVNPHLNILQDPRHGTLPYISHLVLEGNKVCMPKGARHNPDLVTRRKYNDPTFDHYSTLSTEFGITSQYGYFNINKGRTVIDYVVPGIIDVDHNTPQGLQVRDATNFQRLFACDPTAKFDLNDRDALMYIPSSAREGAPVPLFRQLLSISKALEDQPQYTELKEKVDRTLKEVRIGIRNGRGVPLQAFIQLKKMTLESIEEYEQATNQKQIDRALKRQVLDDVIKSSKNKQLYDLFSTPKNQAPDAQNPSQLNILLLYPVTEEEKKAALEVLDKVITPAKLGEMVLSKDAAYHDVLINLIDSGQADALVMLMGKIKNSDQSNKEKWVELIRSQGLIHHVLESNLFYQTQDGDKLPAVGAILDTLEALDPTLDKFGLMMNSTEATEKRTRWSSDALQLAIQNNNEMGLARVLKELPSSSTLYDQSIRDALEQSAYLKHPKLFNLLVKVYNEKNSTQPLTPPRILSITSLFQNSPYHFFLRDSDTTKEIVEPAFQDFSLDEKKAFLLGDPSPLIIAAKNQNDRGLNWLLTTVIDSSDLRPEDKETFFTKTDEEDKNVLNYFLENNQYQQFNQLMESLQSLGAEKASSILETLVSNSNNPILNFLSAQVPNEIKYSSLNRICDGLSKNAIQGEDRSTSKQQDARLLALVLSEKWLIQEANSDGEHPKIKELLHSDGLEWAYKAFLFERLKNAASRMPNSTKAEQYFSDLLKEIKRSEKEEDKQQLEKLTLEIPERVAAITGKPLDELQTILDLTKENAALRKDKRLFDLRMALVGLERDEIEQRRILEVEQSHLQHELLAALQQNLNTQIDDLMRDKKASEQKIASLTTELATSKDRNESTVQGLETQLETEKQNYYELLSSLAHALETPATADNIVGKVIENTQQLMALSQENTNAVAQIKAMQEVERSTQNEMEELKRKYLEQQQQIGLELLDAQRALLHAQSSHREEIAAVGAESFQAIIQLQKQLSNEIEEKENLKDRLESQLVSKTEELVNKEKALTEVNHSVSRLTAELQSAQEKYNQLSASAADSDKANVYKQAEIDTARETVQQLTDQKHANEAKLEALQAQVQEGQKEALLFQAELEMQKAMDDFNKEILEVFIDFQNKQKQDELVKLQEKSAQELKAAGALIEQLQTKLSSALSEYEGLKDSTQNLQAERDTVAAELEQSIRELTAAKVTLTQNTQNHERVLDQMQQFAEERTAMFAKAMEGKLESYMESTAAMMQEMNQQMQQTKMQEMAEKLLVEHQEKLNQFLIDEFGKQQDLHKASLQDAAARIQSLEQDAHHSSEELEKAKQSFQAQLTDTTQRTTNLVERLQPFFDKSSALLAEALENKMFLYEQYHAAVMEPSQRNIQHLHQAEIQRLKKDSERDIAQAHAALSQAMNTFRNEVNAQQEQLNQLRKEQSNLQQTLATQEERSTAEIALLEDRLKTLNEQIISVRHAKDQSEAELRQNMKRLAHTTLIDALQKDEEITRLQLMKSELEELNDFYQSMVGSNHTAAAMIKEELKKVERQAQELNSDVERLKQEKKTDEEKIRELNDLLKESSDSLELLEFQQQRHARELAQLATQSGEEKEKALEEATKAHDVEMRTIRDQLLKENEKTADLEILNGMLQDENRELSLQISKLNSQLKELTPQLGTAQIAHEKAEYNLRKTEEELTTVRLSLERQLHQLRDSHIQHEQELKTAHEAEKTALNENFQQSIDAKMAVIGELRKILNNKEQELEKQRAQLGESQEENETLKERIESQRAIIKDLKASNSLYLQQHTQFEAILGELSDKFEEQHRLLTEQQQDSLALISQNDELQTQVGELQGRSSKLVEENQSLQAKIITLESEVGNLKLVRAQSQDELQQLKEQLRIAEQQNRKLQQELSVERYNCILPMGHVARAQAQLLEQQQELDELTIETSNLTRDVSTQTDDDAVTLTGFSPQAPQQRKTTPPGSTSHTRPIAENVGHIADQSSNTPFGLSQPYHVYAYSTLLVSYNDLFPSPKQAVENVIKVIFPEKRALKDAELNTLRQSGLQFYSPSGQAYTFRDAGHHQPQAVLNHEEARKPLDETNEQPTETQQRLAVTIMNMIDNILAQGSTEINVETDDPFIAGVANEYINQLNQRNQNGAKIRNTSSSNFREEQIRDGIAVCGMLCMSSLTNPAIADLLAPSMTLQYRSFIQDLARNPSATSAESKARQKQ